ATHFAHEEAYMEKINDPELPMQQKEHAAFTARVNSLEASGDFSRDALEELLTFLVRWLYRHILSSDMMIGKMAPKEDSETKEDDPFAFTDKYRTGIELIDQEHKRLFEIIRDVYDVINNQTLHDKYDEIIRLLDELQEYTESHFNDEEEYMESIGYPGLDAQQRAHTAFVEKLVGINLEELDTIDENQEEYLLALIDFLLGWLSNHILKSDLLIADFA
ncbi:MAG: bacteriohemerythrin, partial [Roseburia sp.]